MPAIFFLQKHIHTQKNYFLFTSPLRREVVQVPYVVPVGLDVLVDDVGRDGADLDKAVVLDEDGVAVQVAVDDGGAARLVEVAA